MPSELLLETISMLKQRIELRRRYLVRNEIPTRQLLVDPLLAVLGWDFKDSTRVRLEHSVGPRRADYVLMVNNLPRIVVESKRYGSRLGARAIGQGLNYALWLQANSVVITDGDLWQMYRLVDRNRRIASLEWEARVTDESEGATALSLDRMSYAAIQSNHLQDRAPVS